MRGLRLKFSCENLHAMCTFKSRRQQGIASFVACLMCGQVFAQAMEGMPAKEYRKGNFSKAFQGFYLRATKEAEPIAQDNVGMMYERGEGVSQNYTEAFEWYQLAAEQGYAPAQLHMSAFYARGLGVQRNPQLAFMWCRKAASQGLAQAQRVLGSMYLAAEGTTGDREQAENWLRLAAEQSDIAAMELLGKLLWDSSAAAQAIAWFEKAAAAGSRPATNWLREIDSARHDAAMIKSDPLTYLRQRGNSGDVTAQYNLGALLQQEGGASRLEAMGWYLKAAGQGHANAEFNLAVMYADALDLVEAERWYLRALEQGIAQAGLKLGELAEQRGDFAQTVSYYLRAANQGSVLAFTRLGAMYWLGKGVGKDYGAAIAWYRKAAENGDRQAQQKLAYVYEHGTAVARDLNEAKRWAAMAAAQ